MQSILVSSSTLLQANISKIAKSLRCMLNVEMPETGCYFTDVKWPVLSQGFYLVFRFGVLK